MGDDVDSPDSSAPILEEVEQFLAEHEVSLPSKELHAVYDGHDVAKALAVTWKENIKSSPSCSVPESSLRLTN